MSRFQYARVLIGGVALTAIIGLGGVVVAVLSLPLLPDPVAVHWGPTGSPDGFGPAWVLVVIPALSVVFAGFAWFVASSARGDGSITLAQRAILATGPFLAIVLSTAGAGSAWIQRGLTDAADAPSIVPLLAAGLIGGLVVAVGVWFLLPRHVSPAGPDASTAPALDVAASERVVWVRRAEPTRGVVLLVIGGLALAATFAAAIIWVSAPLANLAIWFGILALVSFAVASTMFWTVRIDGAGLTIRSALGVPHIRVPLAEIESAGVAQINPTRDYGGWGIRSISGKRTGIVVRAGAAIEVQRSGGRVLAVTVDDATTGAALLNGLVARSNAGIQ